MSTETPDPTFEGLDAVHSDNSSAEIDALREALACLKELRRLASDIPAVARHERFMLLNQRCLAAIYKAEAA